MATDKINEATTVASSRSRGGQCFHTIKIHIKRGCVVDGENNFTRIFDYEIIDHDVRRNKC